MHNCNYLISEGNIKMELYNIGMINKILDVAFLLYLLPNPVVPNSQEIS